MDSHPDPIVTEFLTRLYSAVDSFLEFEKTRFSVETNNNKVYQITYDEWYSYFNHLTDSVLGEVIVGLLSENYRDKTLTYSLQRFVFRRFNKEFRRSTMLFDMLLPLVINSEDIPSALSDVYATLDSLFNYTINKKAWTYNVYRT